MFNSFRFGFLSLVFALALAALLAPPAHAISDKYRDLAARLVTDAEQELLQQKAEAADNLLNLALTADPGNARAFLLKGKAQTALGNKDEGLRLVSVGLEIEPGDTEGLRLQGEYAAALGQIEEAETALNRLRSVCDAPCAADEDLSQLIDKARDAQKD
jgi:Tfp pilus assembly protein PilF